MAMMGVSSIQTEFECDALRLYTIHNRIWANPFNYAVTVQVLSSWSMASLVMVWSVRDFECHILTKISNGEVLGYFIVFSLNQ